MTQPHEFSEDLALLALRDVFSALGYEKAAEVISRRCSSSWEDVEISVDDVGGTNDSPKAVASIIRAVYITSILLELEVKSNRFWHKIDSAEGVFVLAIATGENHRQWVEVGNSAHFFQDLELFLSSHRILHTFLGHVLQNSYPNPTGHLFEVPYIVVGLGKKDGDQLKVDHFF